MRGLRTEDRLPALVSPRCLLWAGLGYLAVMAAAISLVHENVSLDGAQQLVWTQSFRLGYGLQPPLYTWLLRTVFGAFGVNLPAMAFFKEALLALSAMLVFDTARRLSGRDLLASLSALGLLLLPQWSYESHRDLSHTVLATVLAAAVLDVAVRLAERPRTGLYVLLGLAGGLGLMAKYNVALFLAALVTAATTLPAWRGVFSDRRFLLSLTLALLVAAPHAWWLATGGFDARLQAEAGSRLGLVADAPWAVGRLRDLGHLALTIGGFAGPLVAALFWALRGGRRATAPSGGSAAVSVSPEDGGDLWIGVPAAGRAPVRDGLRLLRRVTIIEVALVLAGTVVLGVGQHRGRWFLPLLFFLPVLGLLEVENRLDPPAARRITTVAGVVGLLAYAVVIGWTLLLPLQGRWSRYNVPYVALAREIGRPDVATVLAEDYWGAGCLRLRYPEAAVFGANDPPYAERRVGPTLVVGRGEEMPAEIVEVLPRYGIERALARSARVTRLPFRLAPHGSQAFSWLILPTR